MTRSTCLGYLSLPQFTGPEGRELLALLEEWMGRHAPATRVAWAKERPEGPAIGMYYIRDVDHAPEDRP